MQHVSSQFVYRRLYGMDYLYYQMRRCYGMISMFLQQCFRMIADFFKSLFYVRPKTHLSPSMSLQEIESLEAMVQSGIVRLSENETQQLRSLHDTIDFFHHTFPDSDPDHTKKYSLYL